MSGREDRWFIQDRAKVQYALMMRMLKTGYEANPYEVIPSGFLEDVKTYEENCCVPNSSRFTKGLNTYWTDFRIRPEEMKTLEDIVKIPGSLDFELQIVDDKLKSALEIEYGV